jgi:NAD(P)H-quinone oxidoreductase subunit 5
MIYTDGYIGHDPGYVRFYAYLSIFSSSMLGLVISPNLVQILRFLGIGGDVFLSAGRFLVSLVRRPPRPVKKPLLPTASAILAYYWECWVFSTGSFEFDVMGERLEELVSSGAIAGSLAALFAVLVFLGQWPNQPNFPFMSGYRMPWKVKLRFRP